jgi:hypothetical protein
MNLYLLLDALMCRQDKVLRATAVFGARPFSVIYHNRISSAVMVFVTR